MYLHSAKIGLYNILVWQYLETVIIQEIQPNDNVEVVIVIRKVLVYLGVPKTSIAHVDVPLDHMYGNYDVAKAFILCLKIRD